MGHPPSATLANDRELLDARAAALAESDARRYTPRANALRSLAALIVAVGPSLPHGAFVFGGADAATVQLLVAAAWLAYEAAALTHLMLGAHTRPSRQLALVDTVTTWGALLALVCASGSAESPLWAMTLLAAVPLAPAEPERGRFVLAALIIMHVAVGAAFTWSGAVSEALFCALPLMTAILGHLTGARTARRAALARAERDVLRRRSDALARRHERDQIARELHDGVGGSVTALLMSLRRVATRDSSPEAERLAARTQEALERLRYVVKSLR